MFFKEKLIYGVYDFAEPIIDALITKIKDVQQKSTLMRTVLTNLCIWSLTNGIIYANPLIP